MRQQLCTVLEEYIMYLRKSRMDTDFDEVSVEETLNRHRAILTEFAKSRNLNVALVLEEVVSGESLYARPQMLHLLELASSGKYAGVICVDIERLSRGSSLESGYIMQVFKASQFKIITPAKTYDLLNESDEQFTDMKFMFSRYELKSITTRLVRGRNISASEGKFMGSVAPYGYEIYKLAGEKGNSLEIVPEQAEVIRMVYEWYAGGDGYNKIANRLNEMHIPCKFGTHWVPHSVISILSNEVYLGKIRWKYEPTKRVVENGQVIKKREIVKDYLVFEGRHEPIVTQEQWDKVRAVQAMKSHLCVRKDRKPANPFANVLVCAKCGYAIKRNTPSANQLEKRKFRPWYRCGSKGCDCMISYCDIIEDKIVEAMKEWWKDVTLKVAPSKKKEATEETQLDMMRKQLKSHFEQQNQICNLLERGVYSEEMFLKRNAVLQKDIKELQSSIEELEEICHNKSEYEQAREIFLPTTAHILDYYDRMTAEEKNRLWKLLMEKITYYRSPERPDSIEIHLYPRLGRFVNIS